MSIRSVSLSIRSDTQTSRSATFGRVFEIGACLNLFISGNIDIRLIYFLISINDTFETERRIDESGEKKQDLSRK